MLLNIFKHGNVSKCFLDKRAPQPHISIIQNEAEMNPSLRYGTPFIDFIRILKVSSIANEYIHLII